MNPVALLVVTLLVLEALAAVLAWYYQRRQAERWEESAAQQRAQRHNLAEEIADLEKATGTIQIALATAREERDSAQAESEHRGLRIEALDGDLALWKAKADHWQQEYERANADAIKAREVVADWVAQRTFGRSIFGQAPPLPERSTHPHPVPRQRVQGRVAVQMAERQFEKAWAGLNGSKQAPQADTRGAE